MTLFGPGFLLLALAIALVAARMGPRGRASATFDGTITQRLPAQAPQDRRFQERRGETGRRESIRFEDSSDRRRNRGRRQTDSRGEITR